MDLLVYIAHFSIPNVWTMMTSYQHPNGFAFGNYMDRLTGAKTTESPENVLSELNLMIAVN